MWRLLIRHNVLKDLRSDLPDQQRPLLSKDNPNNASSKVVRKWNLLFFLGLIIVGVSCVTEEIVKIEKLVLCVRQNRKLINYNTVWYWPKVSVLGFKSTLGYFFNHVCVLCNMWGKSEAHHNHCASHIANILLRGS